MFRASSTNIGQLVPESRRKFGRCRPILDRHRQTSTNFGPTLRKPWPRRGRKGISSTSRAELLGDFPGVGRDRLDAFSLGRSGRNLKGEGQPAKCPRPSRLRLSFRRLWPQRAGCSLNARTLNTQAYEHLGPGLYNTSTTTSHGNRPNLARTRSNAVHVPNLTDI